MTRNDYRTRVKQMTDKELLAYIDRKIAFVLSEAGKDELNRLTYAQDLAQKRGLNNQPH